MANQHPVPSTNQIPDPIAEARALVAMAVRLGQRTRDAHRASQSVDRKVALYLNTLVRHAARLLQSTDDHNIPVLKAGASGPGGQVTHYVIRHDKIQGPPTANRFLVVGSDARLRCCVASEISLTRIWADYDVTTAPPDLDQRTVLNTLAELISKIEVAVTKLESAQFDKEARMEADMASARMRLAGISESQIPYGKRQAESEEPIRPWTKHLPNRQETPYAAEAQDIVIESHSPDSAVETVHDESTNSNNKGLRLSRLQNAI